MDRRARGGRRQLLGDGYALWICLLVISQAADVLTSGAGLARGTVEANRVAGAILSAGGLALLLLVKLAVVLAVGVAALLTREYGRVHPGRPADLLQILVYRGTQVSVIALTLISINNLVQSLA